MSKATKTDTRDTSSRKYLLTINNPLSHCLTRETLLGVLGSLKLNYYAICDEIGLETNTPHTHIFLYRNGAIRFSTIKNKFPSAHIDIAKGTCSDNRDYLLKTGKHESKSESSVEGSFQEYGTLPVERQGCRNDLADLLDMVKSGLSNAEIIQNEPNYILQLDKIDNIRQTLLFDMHKNVWRDVSTTYVWGKTGTGKTRFIMDKYGYENVYRVTDYAHPFDNYKGQKILLLEEFRSSLKINDMLNYLDGYPLELPCRYNNKSACYTEVFICTNIDLLEQFVNVQKEQKETWNAFLRRLDFVKVFNGSDIEEYTLDDYLKHNNGSVRIL